MERNNGAPGGMGVVLPADGQGYVWLGRASCSIPSLLPLLHGVPTIWLAALLISSATDALHE